MKVYAKCNISIGQKFVLKLKYDLSDIRLILRDSMAYLYNITAPDDSPTSPSIIHGLGCIL